MEDLKKEIEQLKATMQQEMLGAVKTLLEEESKKRQDSGNNTNVQKELEQIKLKTAKEEFVKNIKNFSLDDLNGIEFSSVEEFNKFSILAQSIDKNLDTKVTSKAQELAKTFAEQEIERKKEEEKKKGEASKESFYESLKKLGIQL